MKNGLVAVVFFCVSLLARADVPWLGTDCSAYNAEFQDGCHLAHQVLESIHSGEGQTLQGKAVQELAYLWDHMVAGEFFVGMTLANTARDGDLLKALYKRIEWGAGSEGIVLVEIHFSQQDGKWLVFDWDDYTLHFSGRERAKEVNRFSTKEGYGTIDKMMAGPYLKAYSSGDHKRVVKIFDMLPSTLQENKFYQNIYVSSATQAGEESYEAALEYLFQQYGEQQGYEILSADYFYLKQDYSKARRLFSGLSKRIGGDFHLDMIVGHLYEEEGDCKALYVEAAEILKRYPDNLEALLLPVQCLLNEKRYDEMVVLLETADLIFDAKFSVEDFADYPGAEAFFSSPVYQKAESIQQTK